MGYKVQHVDLIELYMLVIMDFDSGGFDVVEFKDVKIPGPLYSKIEERIEGTSYSSVEDYIIKKLETEFPVELIYTKEEEELIKERLRKLGYIE